MNWINWLSVVSIEEVL